VAMTFDFSSMSDSDLSHRLEKVLAELAMIKDQVECAKVRRIETGEYADPDWYRRANTALRHKGREHQALLMESGKRRRTGNQRVAAASASSKDRVFIRVALRRLSREVFEEIAREAEAVCAAGGSGGSGGAAGENDPLPPEVLRWRHAMKRLKKSLGIKEGADVVGLLEAAADVCENVESCDPFDT